MSFTSISIRRDLKDKLEDIKRKFGFKSMSEVIEFLLQKAGFSGGVDDVKVVEELRGTLFTKLLKRVSHMCINTVTAGSSSADPRAVKLCKEFLHVYFSSDLDSYEKIEYLRELVLRLIQLQQ